jgi:putative transport protein
VLEVNLLQLLLEMPALAVFTAIAFGYLIGNIGIGGVRIGLVGGVLIAALVLGHLGMRAFPLLEVMGFILFIYSVGLQAGPRFFSILAVDGRKYFLLALIVAASALGLAVALTRMADLEQGIAGGILAGALTSTPTLIGAQNAVLSGNITLVEGLTAEEVVANISIGYAITYLFGTIGLMVLIRLLPALLRMDLTAEAAKLAREQGYAEDGRRLLSVAGQARLPLLRAYLIARDEVVGSTVAELREQGAQPLRLKRGNELVEFDDTTALVAGDKVAIIASGRAHQDLRQRLGGEVLDEDLLDDVVDSIEVLVTRKEAVGKRLSELGITRRYGCFVTGVTRAQISLPAEQDITLAKGDVVELTGTRSRLEELAQQLGVVERTVHQTDLLTFAFGICAGLLLGEITLRIGEVSIGLGSAGGLLLVGILFGFLRSIHPTFGRVPPAARFVLMELGLLFFIVGIGFRAGPGIVDALLDVGPVVILLGVMVTTLPLVIGWLAGRYVLRLHPVLLLGALTGAMTSTPALGVITRVANSTLPSLGYAGSYTFANILLTLAGTAIMLL